MHLKSHYYLVGTDTVQFYISSDIYNLDRQKFSFIINKTKETKYPVKITKLSEPGTNKFLKTFGDAPDVEIILTMQ